MAVAVIASAVAASVPVVAQATASPSSVVWRLDHLDTVGGHPVKVVGAPRVVEVNGERVVEFDGAHDGLVVDVNPLAGLARFTIEVVFEPAVDGPEEQRFLHVEEPYRQPRADRAEDAAGRDWCLDTYLRHGEANLTLIDRDRTHTAGQWHVAALTFDGKTMTDYVDRERQGSGEVVFLPMKAAGLRSACARTWCPSSRVAFACVRFTPEALAPNALLEPRG